MRQNDGKHVNAEDKMLKNLMYTTIIWIVLIAVNGAVAAVATFDDPAMALAPETHWGGAGSIETGFFCGDIWFPHDADDWSWSGFVYSSETDTTNPGFMNQFSAVTGTGVEDSSNYGVAAIPLDWMSGTFDPIPQTVSFETDTTVAGVFLTNTTYTYFSMRDGDGFAKKFGGIDGTDSDYLRIIITGYDQYEDMTGMIIFYLADFRSPDNSKDYIVDQWEWVDLSALGTVVKLEFTMESSDTGMFGINTPTYFALDSLTTISDSVEVIVDIRPGSKRNPVNAAGRGCLPVTISGLESLNVDDIDFDSLRLQGVAPLHNFRIDVSGPSENPENTSPTVLGADGFADVIMLFDAQEIIAALGDVSDGQVCQLDLTGTLSDGTPITGSDEILIILKKKWKYFQR